MDNSAKILLLGKTGVGKSSFINYFIGKDIAKAGYGRPVTQEYFIPYEIHDNRYPITVFDTKGLEAKDANRQVEEIVGEVKKRNNSDNVMNWFHTIFYCISMADPRFQDFEADMIRRLQRELTQHIHIIITQCDKSNPEKIREMKSTIKSKIGRLDNIEIIEVISVSVKKRSGTVEPKGKEVLDKRVFELLSEDIAYKVSATYAAAMWEDLYGIINYTKAQTAHLVDKWANLGTLIKIFMNDNQFENEMDDCFEEMERDFESVSEKNNERLINILKPAVDLYSSYRGIVTNTFEEDVYTIPYDIMSNNLDWLDEITDGEIMSQLMPRLAENFGVDLDDFDDANIFTILKAIGCGIGDLFSFKSNLNKLLDNMFNDMYNSIPSEEEIQESTYEKIMEIFNRP